MSGRSITDNVLVSFEVIHHTKRKTGGKDGEVSLKLDISKAYDRVYWNIWKHRMRSMGFCHKWINWVMLYMTTVSYDVCFNGSSIGPIISKRGLSQGDPLSPYLFLFCVEGLSNSIDQAAILENIHGCRISPTTPFITHLLFMDDSFMFFKANLEETKAVKTLLNEYEKISGQSVNFQKYGVFFSSNVRRDKQKELTNMFGVSNEMQDNKCLGLPSLVGISKKRCLDSLKIKCGNVFMDGKQNQF